MTIEKINNEWIIDIEKLSYECKKCLALRTLSCYGITEYNKEKCDQQYKLPWHPALIKLINDDDCYKPLCFPRYKPEGHAI